MARNVDCEHRFVFTERKSIFIANLGDAFCVRCRQKKEFHSPFGSDVAVVDGEQYNRETGLKKV